MEFLKRNPGTGVSVRYLPSHKYANTILAAAAAVCASEQGAFPAMHSLLLSDTGWFQNADWPGIAEAARVADPEEWQRCMMSPETSEALATDSLWSIRTGIHGTPVILAASGNRLIGAVTYDELSSWLMEEVSPDVLAREREDPVRVLENR